MNKMDLAELIEQLGKCYSYFRIKKICEFKEARADGLCKIKTEAIEFDYATEKIHEGGNKPKSCDALDVFGNQINFIEFTRIPANKKFDDVGREGELVGKIEDSEKTLFKAVKEKLGSSGEIEECYRRAVISIGIHLSEESQADLSEAEISRKMFFISNILGMEDSLKFKVIPIETENFDEVYSKKRRS